MYGFSLVNTLVMAFAFSVLGSALLIMSDIGFSAFKAEAKAYISKVNSELALHKGLYQYLTTETCKAPDGGEEQTGNDNGGSWRIKYKSIDDPETGNNIGCFIWAEGRKDNAVDLRVVYATLEADTTLAGLTINYINTTSFDISSNALIKEDDDSECPSMGYYSCGSVCDNINANRSHIESLLKLKEPVDIISNVFKDGYDVSDLKSFVRSEFHDNYSSFETDNIVYCDNTAADVQEYSNIKECETVEIGGVYKLKCKRNDNSDVYIDPNITPKVKISGTTINSIRFQNADISFDEFYVCADNTISSFVIDNATLSANRIHIEAKDTIESFQLNNTACINLSPCGGINPEDYYDTFAKNKIISLVADKVKTIVINGPDNVIVGNVFIKSDPDIEENYTTEIKFQNSNSKIVGDFYASTKKLSVEFYNNNQAIYGKTYIYGKDSVDINMHNVNSYIGFNDGENVIYSESKIGIFLNNNNDMIKGKSYIVTTNDGGETRIFAENNSIDEPIIKGLIVSDYVGTELKAKRSIRGLILSKYLLGCDDFGNYNCDFQLDNNVSIEGLLVALERVGGGFKMMSNSKLEGLFLFNSTGTGEFIMDNNAVIQTNIQLVRDLIDYLGLSDILKTISCKKLSGSSKRLIYYLPPATAY